VLIIIIVLLLLVLLFNFLYFILPSLSPIPFFPTNKKDLPMIVKALVEMEKNGAGGSTGGSPRQRVPTYVGRTRESPAQPSIVIDLGAGTGTVIFAAAWQAYQQGLDTQFVAVEIHPLLVLIMHLRRLVHPHRKNISVIRADIFKINYQQLAIKQSSPPSSANRHTSEGQGNITIYMYVGTFVMERLKKQLIKLPRVTRIVSYMYEIPGWKKKLIESKQHHKKIFIYLS